jgi:hypothetical protein
LIDDKRRTAPRAVPRAAGRGVAVRHALIERCAPLGRIGRIAAVRRRLFNFLTALSLLLCVSAVVLWVRSYSYFEQVRYGRAPFAIRLESQSGICKADWTTQWPGLSYGLATQDKAVRPVDRERGSGYFLAECSARVGSFGYGRTTQAVGFPRQAATPTTFTIVTAPHWGLVLTAAVLPALWVVHRHRSRNRPHAGLCRACGYDLRATPGRCPECGTVTAAATSPASPPTALTPSTPVAR